MANSTVSWQEVRRYLLKRQAADDFKSRSQLAADAGVHFSTYRFRKLCDELGIKKGSIGGARENTGQKAGGGEHWKMAAMLNTFRTIAHCMHCGTEREIGWPDPPRVVNGRTVREWVACEKMECQYKQALARRDDTPQNALYFGVAGE